LSSASDQVLPLLSTAEKAGAGLPGSLVAKAAGASATAALPTRSERRGTMNFDMLAS